MRTDLVLAALLLAGPLLAGPLHAGPAFRPVNVPAHVYAGGWAYFVGGGIAAFDCNGDHLPELFAAGGTNPAILLKNRSVRAGALAFVDATPPELALKHVIGAYPLDIDSDGITDLAVLRLGKNLLLKGLGNCRFKAMTGLGFKSGARWSTAFSATFERGQTLPTLAFGNYVDRANPKGPFKACDINLLYRPKGGLYPAPTPLRPAFCPLSMLFSDWGRTGRADLRISNDRHYYVTGGQEQLWAMEPQPRLYTARDGWRRQMLWGMGIASRDITGDGVPEIYLSSMGDQKLETRLPGADGPAYGIVPFSRGTAAQRPYTGGDGRPSTGWQISFGDVNNDGRDDVFISKGNVDQMMNSAIDDPNNLLMQGADGRFHEAGKAAGVASLARARGAVLTDLNLDGRLDLALVNRRAPLEVYQNLSKTSGGWLELALAQRAPNVNAIGAFIEVRTAAGTQTREITVGGGHASGRLGAEHFGLGSAKDARIRVTWPDGRKSRWITLARNQAMVLRRDKGELALMPY